MTDYFALTSDEKAKAQRLFDKGLVRIHREIDSRVLIVGGKHRLVNREIYVVQPVEATA